MDHRNFLFTGAEGLKSPLVPVLLLLAVLGCDQPSSVSRDLRDIDGTWYSRHYCKTDDVGRPLTPMYAASLTIDRGSFSVTTYRDTSFNAIDTTYSGRCFVSPDSILFELAEFSQMYVWYGFGGEVSFTTMWELQSGNPLYIGDFHSILTPCDGLKRIHFTP